MSKTPTLSIIVPIYDAEQYLRECLDSILASTFSDFELILVDDGSPDACPSICDEYAKKDARIRVIHQKNTGVSAARNNGIAASTGSYLGFVDSDDRVLPEMFEHMVASIQAEAADIVCCGMRFLWDELDDVAPFVDWPKEKKIFWGSDSLYLPIAPDGAGDFFMNKLFQKSLFESLRLPEGKVFEDIYLMHQIFEKSKKTIFLPEGLYEYRKRENSLSHSETWTPRVLDYPASCKKQYRFIKEKYPKFTDIATRKYVTSILAVARKAVMDNAPNKKELLNGFRRDLFALGDDLLLCPDVLQKRCRLLQKRPRAWNRHFKAVKFYESLHNHPTIQKVLRPLIKPD